MASKNGQLVRLLNGVVSKRTHNGAYRQLGYIVDGKMAWMKGAEEHVRRSPNADVIMRRIAELERRAPARK